MRRIAALSLVVALSIYGAPSLAAAAPQTGVITGVAQASGGAPFANHTARLRSVQTGDVVASTRTSASGSFEFSNLFPGGYVIEIADASGKVVGISGVTTVSAGGTMVAAITASTPVVGGAVSTPRALLLVAAGIAGAVGVWAARRPEASPSR